MVDTLDLGSNFLEIRVQVPFAIIFMLILFLWFPFFGFLSGIFLGNFLGIGVVYLTIINIGIVVLLSFYLFISLIFSNNFLFLPIAIWIRSGSLLVNWELGFDSLTISMLCIVTLISFLVHLYSSEYMQEDPHLPRFMSYLSLFTFFMIILVTANNFIQMFVGWEGVGLSSYLLINFWFNRIQANKAAIKAMLFNRVADFLMILSLGAIFILFDTFDYVIILNIAPLVKNYFFTFGTFLNIPLINAIDFICIFLFLGAMGKSAQLGFHNWLPDAMEGPTPVSALIHAATMVTAGVFLLIRCSGLFVLSTNALTFIAIIGALTALFGSSVGLFCHDLKRVIAFSTCSQLGYMMLACGLEQFNAAFFHLIIHAFFKALLFLAAGSIIHAVFDEQDARKLGGLFKFLPITYICFLIGSLNLMGIPFLSGFYTKDMILELAASTNTILGLFCYILGCISVFFTAAYSTRLLILVFLSKINLKYSSILNTKENNVAIMLPLIFLSIISIFSGNFLSDIFLGFGTSFFNFSILLNINTYIGTDVEFLPIFLKLLPLILTFIGFFFSFYMYLVDIKNFFFIKKQTNFKYIYQFFLKKWYLDRFVNQIFSINFLEWSKTYAYVQLDRGLLERMGPTFIAQNTSTFFYVDHKRYSKYSQFFY